MKTPVEYIGNIKDFKEFKSDCVSEKINNIINNNNNNNNNNSIQNSNFS